MLKELLIGNYEVADPLYEMASGHAIAAARLHESAFSLYFSENQRIFLNPLNDCSYDKNLTE